jgi:hypothetical protein
MDSIGRSTLMPTNSNRGAGGAEANGDAIAAAAVQIGQR